MAKIVATMDTKEKTFSISVNGNNVPGACCARFYMYGEYPSVEIEANETEKDSDVYVTKYIRADKENMDGVEVKINSGELEKSIGEFLK